MHVMERLMHRALILTGAIFLTGCQSLAGSGARSDSAAGDMLGKLADALPGEYDNHEQVAHGASGAVLMHVQHDLRIVERERDHVAWLWRLRAVGQQPLTSVWFLRAQAVENGRRIRIVPFRPLDPAAADALFVDPAKPFHYAAEQWAELAPCALDGAWNGGKFAAAASVEACSVLLPGLGEKAALLPLRLMLEGDMLHVASFADSPRGAGAVEDARRVRWFTGWAAINGGGPQAKAGNQDWHFDRDVRLSSEGGRAVVHWRDGTPSGYTLELERTSYPERKLAVLQLNVIEDASGKSLTYAWTDPQAISIGMNLGWLQVGFGPAATAAAK
jgi:hypothetical protein